MAGRAPPHHVPCGPEGGHQRSGRGPPLRGKNGHRAAAHSPLPPHSRRHPRHTPQEALGLDDRQEDARGLLRYYGLRQGVEEALWSKLDAVYFMRHSAEEIAWHTRLLYYRSEAEEPVVKVRIAENGEGLQVMVFARDQKDLFMRVCSFFAKLGFTILDAKVHTTRHGYALDSFILQDPGQESHYRDISSLIEHDLAERIMRQGPVDRPTKGRLSRQLKHFPITPYVRIQPDDAGRNSILSLTAP